LQTKFWHVYCNLLRCSKLSETVFYMHGNGSFIRLGQLKGTVTRLHNHHFKKANVIDDGDE